MVKGKVRGKKYSDEKRTQSRGNLMRQYIENELKGIPINLEQFYELKPTIPLAFLQNDETGNICIFQRDNCEYKTVTSQGYKRTGLFGKIKPPLRILNINIKFIQDLTQITLENSFGEEWDLNSEGIYIIRKNPGKLSTIRKPEGNKTPNKKQQPYVRQVIDHRPRER